MSWCPNCRSEYVSGRETCYDCGAVLVESLEEIQEDAKDSLVFDALPEEMKRRVIQELQKEKINPNSVLHPAKEGTLDYVAQVIEEENAPSYEEFEREEIEAAKKRVPALFVKTSDRMNDYLSSGYMLIIVGILGLAYMIVEITGIFSFFASPNYIFYVVMTALFLLFFGAGIHSLAKAKKLAPVASAENQYLTDTKNWIDQNILVDSINAGLNDSMDIDTLYEQRSERIRHALHSYDANMNPSMLEYFVENTYINLFES